MGYKKKYKRTKAQLKQMTAYADKLAAGLPEGMLPKDVELIRDANWSFAQENQILKERLSMIFGLTVGHDGFDTVEGLRSLVNDIALAVNGKFDLSNLSVSKKEN